MRAAKGAARKGARAVGTLSQAGTAASSDPSRSPRGSNFDPSAAIVETPRGEPRRGVSFEGSPSPFPATFWGTLSSIFRPSRPLWGSGSEETPPRGSPRASLHWLGPWYRDRNPPPNSSLG